MKNKWLLALYPEPWRVRYEDEFAAVLDECPVSPHVIIDVIIGAIDAQLQLDRVMGSQLALECRLRRKVFVGFGTCILFMFGVWLFSSAVDDSSFVIAMRRSPALAIPWLTMEIGFGLMAIGIAITNLPIALTVLRQLLTHHKRHLWLAGVPVLSLVSLCLYLVLIPQLIDPIATPPVSMLVGYGFWLLLWSAIIASVVAICRAIRLSTVPTKALSLSLIGGRGATVGMSFIAVAAICWLGIAMRVSSSSFNEPGFLNLPPVVTFVLGILYMVLAIAIMGQTVIRSHKFSME